MDSQLGTPCLPHAPIGIDAGEVGHCKRPHRKAEAHPGGIDLFGQGAFQQQALCLYMALGEHAIADETIADADHDRHFA